MPTYNSSSTQPHSASNKIGYDINPQPYYNLYQPTTGTCQCYTQQKPAITFTGNPIRSPTPSYPPSYVTYSTNAANTYSYALSMGHQGHTAMYEDVPRIDPCSSSPYSRNSGTSHVSPPRVHTPTPISLIPSAKSNTGIKKKRKRADAAQLKVLNETYNRTTFPSTEERIALAEMLDMSARSVQIW